MVAPVGRPPARLVAEPDIRAVRRREERRRHGEIEIERGLVVGIILARPPRSRGVRFAQGIDEGVPGGGSEEEPRIGRKSGVPVVEYFDFHRIGRRDGRGKIDRDEARRAGPFKRVARRLPHARDREHVVRVELDMGERPRERPDPDLDASFDVSRRRVDGHVDRVVEDVVEELVRRRLRRQVLRERRGAPRLRHFHLPEDVPVDLFERGLSGHGRRDGEKSYRIQELPQHGVSP